MPEDCFMAEQTEEDLNKKKPEDPPKPDDAVNNSDGADADRRRESDRDREAERNKDEAGKKLAEDSETKDKVPRARAEEADEVAKKLLAFFDGVKEGVIKSGKLMRPGEPERKRGSEIPDTMDSGISGQPGSGDSNIWRDYRVGFRDTASGAFKDVQVPGKEEPIIGRHVEKADIVVNDPEARVSRIHAKFSMKDGKPHIEDMGSLGGTTILRDGQEIEVKKGQPQELKPGDIIRLGPRFEISFSKPGPPQESWSPKGYSPEKVNDGARQEEKDKADPAASKVARDASNSYLKNHEYSGVFPPGFQVGGLEIDEKGKHNDPDRPSVIVDTRAGKDPALQKFIEEIQRDLAHLKDKPEELAKEIAKRAKAAMQPEGWSEKAVDDAYYKFRDENRGKQLMLGDFLEAAKQNKGAGNCNHQSLLTKVAFDSMYGDEKTRPELKLVRGFYGDNPAGKSREESINHAWLTLNSGGREKIFDPRMQIYGEPVEARPSHQPGKEIPQLQTPEAKAASPPKDRAQDVYSKVVGKDVGYLGQTWKVHSVDAAANKVVLSASGMRNESVAKVNELNPGRDLVVGDTYTITRSNGEKDSGWKLVGYRDPETKKDLIFTKENAYQRTVPMDSLREKNEHVFAQAEKDAAEKPVIAPVKAAEIDAKAQEYGLVEGREVKHNGRTWIVSGTQDGKIELTRPSERLMGPDEFKRLNGDREPKPGEEINYQRSTGEIQKWRVVSYDKDTGALRVRNEEAHKESVPLEKLLHENPKIREAHAPVDMRSLMADPRSKVRIECRWTDGNSGHNLYIGSVEGPNGESVKVMIHKPPFNVDKNGGWDRANKDMAAQSLAQMMGAPGLFPETVMRDGMMIQKFIGREGENIQSYLHQLSRQDAQLRAAHRSLEDRIFHMMDKADPKLKTELARSIAFSALLGDHDQHGMNFVMEKTGPNTGDVRIARIDTDYAFSQEKEPQLMRKPNYGDVVNGLFRYYSEKELPPEVRAEIKQVSDKLSSADASVKNEARQIFRDRGLSEAQIDALADRAKFLAEGGKFPKSVDIRSMGEEMMAKPVSDGSVLGTVNEAKEFKIEDAIEKLKTAGLKEEKLNELKTAYEALAKDAVANKEAIDTIKALADTTNGMSKAKREALIELAAASAKDPLLPIDHAGLRAASEARVAEMAAIASKALKLNDLSKAGIDTATIERIKADSLKLAQSNPAKAAEISRVLDKLADANFAREFGPERMRSFAELLSIPERNRLIDIPFTHLLDKDVSKETLAFAAAKYKEAAIGFKTPRTTDSGGNRYEYNASIAAMEAVKAQIKGKNMLFIPAGHGSQADASGIDGIFIDTKAGTVYPIDWTKDLAGKFESGKDKWAASPDKRIIGEHIPPDGKMVKAYQTSDPAQMGNFIDGFVNRNQAASVDTKDLAKDKVPFPSLGAARKPTGDAPELAGLRDFVKFVDRTFRGSPANPVLAELYKRSKDAIPHYDASRLLAERLATSLTHNMESQGRRDGSVVFDQSKAPVEVDTPIGKREKTGKTRNNEVTGKPMKFIEIDLDKTIESKADVNERHTRDSQIKKIRLYEDGSIIGLREFTDSKGAQVREMELGHVKDMAGIVKARLESISGDETRKLKLQGLMDKLADVSASNPIDFKHPSDLVQVFGEAITQGGPLAIAAQRVRSLDHIMKNVPGIDEKTAAEVLERTGGKKVKVEELQRIHETIKLESEYKIDTKKAEAVLDKASEFVSKEGVDASVAREAAILNLLESKSKTEALETAKARAEIRAYKPELPAEKVNSFAALEMQMKQLFNKESDRRIFTEALKDAIANGKDGEEVKSIYERMLLETNERGNKEKAGEDTWAHAYLTLAEMGEKGFAKFLGLPEGANAQEVKDHLSELGQRLAVLDKAALPAQVVPTSADKLNVSKSMMNAEMVGRFHEMVDKLQASLKASPEDAGARLREAVFNFLNKEEVKEALLDKDRFEIVISKDKTSPELQFSTGEGEAAKKVVRVDGKFFLEDGKTEVAADKVNTRLIMPESKINGPAGELSRSLYAALLEQSNKGSQASLAADRAGIHAFVTESLKKHVSLPAEASTGGQGEAKIDVSKLPPIESKVAELEITKTGIKIGGVDREVGFAEIWSDRIKNLEAKLKGEEEKKEGKDQKLINELKAAIAAEKDMYAKLSNGSHPEHKKAMEKASKMLEGFRPTERDIERLAGERGGGANVRGRLVALTILASAFIAWNEKRAQAAEAADTKAGGAPDEAPPAHGEIPVGAGAVPLPAARGAFDATPQALPAPKPELRGRSIADTMEGPGGEGDVPDHERLADKPAEKPKEGDKPQVAKLESLPEREMTQQVMARLMPEINRNLAILNEKAKRDGKPEVAMIDEKKVKEEWAKGEFGPESQKLWQESKKLLENESLFWMQLLDMRGMQFPPGAPYGPGMSESGSQLREGDALFRSRLRNGEITPGLGLKDLKAGELPPADDVAKLINTYTWMLKAQSSHKQSVLEGQTNYIKEQLAGFGTTKPVDWKPPKDATSEELEKFRAAAVPWLETATRVRTYAETIAAYNFATTTQGRDWPSLQDGFKRVFVGKEGENTVFPDDALKDPDFPGEIIRKPNGGVEVKLDMPEGLDRNRRENVEKIEKMERWLAKWGPQVDQVSKELALAMQDQDRMLLHVEDMDFELKHSVKKDELEKFKAANSGLKGDDSDVGKFVKVPPHGQGDWMITKRNQDGSYELGKRAPNGEEFNLKRYSFDTVACDKDGKPDPKGEYVKITGHQDYLWARDHAYNNWDFIPWAIKQVDRKVTMEPKVFHKNEMVPIIDNGRLRLMQAGKVESWSKAQEWGKQTGNVITAVVDAGMLVSGLYEARAGWMAAKAMGEKGILALSKAALKEGAWHLGLGVTGFGKQFIVNRVPYGKELMEIRHWAIMADLTVGLLPANAQKAFWNTANVFKWGKGAQQAESAVEAFQLGRVMVQGTEVPLRFAWYDAALKGAHKLYEGWRVGDAIPKVGKFLPPLGAFPVADFYFLSQFSDTLAAMADKHDPQREKIYDAMARHRIAKDQDKPLYYNPLELTAEQLKKAMEPTVKEYSTRLGSTSRSANAQSDLVTSAVKEALKLPADHQDRQKLAAKLAETWQKGSPAEKMAAAAGLLELSKGEDQKPAAEIAGIKTAELTEKLARQPEAIAQKTAELKDNPQDKAAIEAYKKELAGYFASAGSSQEKAAAAKALLALSSHEGKLTALPADAKLDINAVKSYYDRTAEGLLSRMPDAAVQGPDSAERQKLARDAAAVFQSRTASENDKVAAAIVLMSMRGGDVAGQNIAGTTVNAKQALDYLGERARNSSNPEVKMAAGDFLFRSAQMTQGNIQQYAQMAQAAEQKLADAEKKLEADKEDAVLKKSVADAKAELEKAKGTLKDGQDFMRAVNYSAADFASTLMDILKNDNASKQLKLEAIASTNGPRLAAIAEHLKFNVEPSLLQDPNENRRIDGLAGLYGRDAAAIEKFMRDLASDKSQDKDLRAVASQSLAMLSSSRATVNGTPMTPGTRMKIGSAGDVKLQGEGISAQHAEIEMGRDGKKYIRSLDATKPTWIVRNGEYKKVEAGSFSEIKSGDTVIIGDKNKGKALFFSNERTDALASMAADVKNKGANPGAISEAYLDKMLKDLQAPLPPMAGLSQHQRTELMLSRLMAAQAAADLGPDVFGNDKEKASKAIANALADCVKSDTPEIVIAALGRIDVASMSAMTPANADAVRQQAFQILSNLPDTDAGHALREQVVRKMPELFEGATKSQQGKAQRYLESLLIPDAQRDFYKRDKGVYPIYPAGQPELRVQALQTLAKLNPDRAAELATTLLLGGDYNGRKIAPDASTVRMQAVDTLQKVLPLEVNEIALKALRSEKDPAVLAKLWNLEYGSRPDMDPAKAMREIEALDERVRKRAQPGLLNDGKAAYEAYREKHRSDWITMARREASGFFGYSDKQGDLYDPRAVEARKALIYAATHPELELAGELAAAHLAQIAVSVGWNEDSWKERNGEKMARELSGPLEAALLSNPQMSAEARLDLVRAYTLLKPGENGTVSKDEAALVLSRVLENELKRMPRVPFNNYDEHGKSLALQERIMGELSKLKSDKVTPLLEALSYKEPLRSVDEKGRPRLVDYGNGLSRRFEWDSKDNLLRFTEMPSGKVYERDEKEAGTFRTKDGEVLKGVKVNIEMKRYREVGYEGDWMRFDRGFNVKGDYADFRYEKDGKSYVQKPNGMLIEEELGAGTRKVTLNYPGGKESREFLFKQNGANTVDLTVTGKPDGSKESWTLKQDIYGFQMIGKGANGQRLLPMHSGSWQRMPVSMGGRVIPWNFDRGQYQYVDGNTLRLVDSNAAVTEIRGEGGKETLVKKGYGDPAAHPLREISLRARVLSNDQKETTQLAKEAAEVELRYIKQAEEKDKTFESAYGKNSDTTKMADAMGKVLANREADGFDVVKALHMGMLAKPLENDKDPRLTVLRAALRDGNDMVRLAAASYLLKSPNPLDKEGVAFALADISKNGSSAGRAKEAQGLLDSLKGSDAKLVERALAETPERARNAETGRPDGLAMALDARYQNAFEKIRRSLLEGPKDILSWDWQQWNKVTKDLNLDLLSWSGYFGAENRAQQNMEGNLGKMSKFFMGKEELEAKRKEARESVVPQFWESMNQLKAKAMDTKDDDPKGIQARQALAYIVMSNGRELPNIDRQRAVNEAVDAIAKICEGNGPGRGDMDWVLKSLLTEKIDLSAANKARLVGALDALADPKKGKISAENASGIAALALEQEMRFMPRPGQEGYKESIEYQNKLLTMIEKHGNREMIPALQYIARQHSDLSVREKADATKVALEKRVSVGVERVVQQMLSEQDGAARHPSIKTDKDQRIPFLLSALSDSKLSASERQRAAEILLAPENKGVSRAQKLQAAQTYSDLALKNSKESERYKAADIILDPSNANFSDRQRFEAARVMGELSINAQDKERREKAGLAINELSGPDAAGAAQGIIDALQKESKDAPGFKENAVRAFDKAIELYEKSDKGANAQAAIMQAAHASQSYLGANHASSQKLKQMFGELAKDKTPVALKSNSDPRLAQLDAALKGEDPELKRAALQILLAANEMRQDSISSNPVVKKAIEEVISRALGAAGENQDQRHANELLKNLRSENMPLALERISKEFPKQEAYDLVSRMPKEAAQTLMASSTRELARYIDRQLGEQKEYKKSYDKLLTDPRYGESIKAYNKAIGQSSEFQVPEALKIRPEVLKASMDHLTNLYKGSQRHPGSEAEFLKAYNALAKVPEANSPQFTEMKALVARAAADMKASPIKENDPRLAPIMELLNANTTTPAVKAGFAAALIAGDSALKAGDPNSEPFKSFEPYRAKAWQELARLADSTDVSAKAVAEKAIADAIATIKTPVAKNDPVLNELMKYLPTRGADKARVELASKLLSKEAGLTPNDELWHKAWRQAISAVDSPDPAAKAQAKKLLDGINKNSPEKGYVIKEFLEAGMTRVDIDNNQRNVEFWKEFKSFLDKLETPKDDRMYKFAEKFVKDNQAIPSTGDASVDLEAKAKQASEAGRSWEARKLFEQSIKEKEKTLPEGHIDIARARLRYADFLGNGRDAYLNRSEITAQTEAALASFKKHLPEAVETAALMQKLAAMHERGRSDAKAAQLYLDAAAIYEKKAASSSSDYAQALSNAASALYRSGDAAKANESMDKVNELLKKGELGQNEKALLYTQLYRNITLMINTNKEGSKEKGMALLKEHEAAMKKLDLSGLDKQDAEKLFLALWWAGRGLDERREKSKDEMQLAYPLFEKALEAGAKAKGEADTEFIGLYGYYGDVLKRNGEAEKAKVYQDKYQELLKKRQASIR